MLISREDRLDVFMCKDIYKKDLEKELVFDNDEIPLSEVLSNIKVNNSDVLLVGEGVLDIDFGYYRKK